MVYKKLIQSREQEKQKAAAAQTKIPAAKPEEETKRNPVEEKSPAASRSPSNVVAPGLSKEVLGKVTANVAQSVTENLIAGDDLPKTASAFESNVNAFKKSVDRLFFYVRKFSAEHLSNIYKKSEMEVGVFQLIVQSLRATGVNEDPSFCLNFLETITKLNKFDLWIKFLVAKEKQDVATLISELEAKVSDRKELAGKLRQAFKL
eukprot:TRINITY_DN7940_c0_g1_i6.p1 TRINITY_DN7940_c0_g1~~TRINITY_DN7940_c0_g1_i6.p1  ORF type:complete len:205 (-),score=61.33 TRINITY_DN7940_c0_g1_i6:144-758(-)